MPTSADARRSAPAFKNAFLWYSRICRRVFTLIVCLSSQEISRYHLCAGEWTFKPFLGHFYTATPPGDLSLTKEAIVADAPARRQRDSTLCAFQYLQLRMEYQVDGEDISPEDCTEEMGWKEAETRRSRNKQAAVSVPAAKGSTEAGVAGDARASRSRYDTKHTIVRAGRMPPLPKDFSKIVLRPRGGLNISRIGTGAVADAIVLAAGVKEEEAMQDIICSNLQQNIMVASTPDQDRASRYLKVKQIDIGGKVFEVSAYAAAPHDTCKGVIRGIPVSDTQDILTRKIVNANNPLALQAKRIKDTGTIIIAFEGHKVPRFVRYGPSLLQCSLYRKNIDICYVCGKLGHRSDVCPNPAETICRGCEIKNPDSLHQCNPRCRLCDGHHPTADKECKNRFLVPYVVRRRRWERSRAAAEARDASITSSPDINDKQLIPAYGTQSIQTTQEQERRPHSRGRSRSRRGSRPKARSQSRGRSSSQGHHQGRDQPGRHPNGQLPGVQFEITASHPGRTPAVTSKGSWAERVRNGGAEVMTGKLPEHDRIAQLEQENARLTKSNERLSAELKEIKILLTKLTSAQSSQPMPQPVDVPVAENVGDSRTAKKRAVMAEHVEANQTTMSDMKEVFDTLSKVVANLSEQMGRLQSSVAALEEHMTLRITKVEAYLHNTARPPHAPSSPLRPPILVVPNLSTGAASGSGRPCNNHDGSAT